MPDVKEDMIIDPSCDGSNAYVLHDICPHLSNLSIDAS
jgi:hypothetical protein